MAAVKLSSPIMCLVTDRRLCPEGDLVLRVVQAVEGGVNMVQLREKDLSGGQLLKLALELKKAMKGKALLFVNERVDVALVCGADGAQLGEDAMSPSEVRPLVKDNLLVGRSVHSVEGALTAQRQGVDLLIAGAIFPSLSHQGGPVNGVAFLRGLSNSVDVPFMAIGGVNASNVAEVIDAGASGVAVISAILSSGKPGEAAATLRQAIDSAWESRRGPERVSKR